MSGLLNGTACAFDMRVIMCHTKGPDSSGSSGLHCVRIAFGNAGKIRSREPCKGVSRYSWTCLDTLLDSGRPKYSNCDESDPQCHLAASSVCQSLQLLHFMPFLGPDSRSLVEVSRPMLIFAMRTWSDGSSPAPRVAHVHFALQLSVYLLNDVVGLQCIVCTSSHCSGLSQDYLSVFSCVVFDVDSGMCSRVSSMTVTHIVWMRVPTSASQSLALRISYFGLSVCRICFFRE